MESPKSTMEVFEKAKKCCIVKINNGLPGGCESGAAMLAQIFMDRGYQFVSAHVKGGWDSYHDGTAAFSMDCDSFDSFKSTIHAAWEEKQEDVRRKTHGTISVEEADRIYMTFKKEEIAEEIRVCYCAPSSHWIEIAWLQPCPDILVEIGQVINAVGKLNANIRLTSVEFEIWYFIKKDGEYKIKFIGEKEYEKKVAYSRYFDFNWGPRSWNW